MAADLILGKDVSEKIYADLRERIARLKQNGIVPGLAVILVGDDPASQVYVGMKDKKCVELGINSYQHILPASTTQEELMAKIRELNADDSVSGILVQLPLPRHLDESARSRHYAYTCNLSCRS